MSVELPFAPVDAVIRRHAGDLKVSAGAAESLSRCIQDRGAALAVTAAERATANDRKTLMVDDFELPAVDRSDVALPIAPVDRIARLKIEDSYRVSMDARIALAAHLEAYAEDIAATAAILARHANRRTIKVDDIDRYFDIAPYFK